MEYRHLVTSSPLDRVCLVAFRRSIQPDVGPCIEVRGGPLLIQAISEVYGWVVGAVQRGSLGARDAVKALAEAQDLPGLMAYDVSQSWPTTEVTDPLPARTDSRSRRHVSNPIPIFRPWADFLFRSLRQRQTIFYTALSCLRLRTAVARCGPSSLRSLAWSARPRGCSSPSRHPEVWARGMRNLSSPQFARALLVIIFECNCGRRPP